MESKNWQDHETKEIWQGVKITSAYLPERLCRTPPKKQGYRSCFLSGIEFSLVYNVTMNHDISAYVIPNYGNLLPGRARLYQISKPPNLHCYIKLIRTPFLRNLIQMTSCKYYFIVQCQSWRVMLNKHRPNSEAFTALMIQVDVFWDVRPCSVVAGIPTFQATSPWRSRHHGPSTLWYSSTTIYGITTQETSTWKPRSDCIFNGIEKCIN